MRGSRDYLENRLPLGSVSIRPMAIADVAGVVALQRDCFPAPFPAELLWQPEHIRRHLELFPAGQFAAVDGDQVVGSCSNSLISEVVWQGHLGWAETVGGPLLERFAADGNTLYGLDVSVHPSWRGRGILRAFCQRRFDLVRSLGLARYGTAVRLPGFSTFRLENSAASPQDYVEAVKSGAVADPTLTPMLRIGLTLEGVIRGYMDDPESGDAAAVLSWTP